MDEWRSLYWPNLKMIGRLFNWLESSETIPILSSNLTKAKFIMANQEWTHRQVFPKSKFSLKLTRTKNTIYYSRDRKTVGVYAKVFGVPSDLLIWTVIFQNDCVANMKTKLKLIFIFYFVMKLSANKPRLFSFPYLFSVRNEIINSSCYAVRAVSVSNDFFFSLQFFCRPKRCTIELI